MALQHQANVLQSANELSPCVGQRLTSPAAAGSMGRPGGSLGSCVPGRWGGHGGAFLCLCPHPPLCCQHPSDVLLLAGRCICQICGWVCWGAPCGGPRGEAQSAAAPASLRVPLWLSPAAAQRASRSTAGDDIPRHNFIIN